MVSNVVQKNTTDDLFVCSDSCTVRIIEKRVIEDSDDSYSQRVYCPTENLNINYSFEGMDVDLKGTYFGTFHKHGDPDVNIHKDGNSIHITSRKWLLTGNGIIIVHKFKR